MRKINIRRTQVKNSADLNDLHIVSFMASQASIIQKLPGNRAFFNLPRRKGHICCVIKIAIILNYRKIKKIPSRIHYWMFKIQKYAKKPFFLKFRQEHPINTNQLTTSVVFRLRNSSIRKRFDILLNFKKKYPKNVI